jgi:hypothetical protein
MFGKRGLFGKKGGAGAEAPAPERQGSFPIVRRDSDGKKRVFGEETYEKHGDFLREIGFDINDPKNILPEPEDFDRKVQASLNRQEIRRQAIEADLLAKHGCNAIRPFFVLAEPVMNSKLDAWLIQVMDLMPYDDWNLVYLPTDQATAHAMGLPFHPGVSIKPIDELMVERIGDFYARYEEGRRKAEALMGSDGDIEMMEKFLNYKDNLRRIITDYVESLKPKIIALIADVQSKAKNA